MAGPRHRCMGPAGSKTPRIMRSRSLLAIPIMLTMLATPGDPAAAQLTASPTRPIISRERILEIRARAFLRPEPVPVDPLAAQALGLTTSVPFLVKQASYGTLVPRRSHYFSFPTDGSPRLLVMEVEGGNWQLWVCDMEGNLLAAATIIGSEMSMRSLDVARPFFEEEMRLWASIDDYSPRAQSHR